MQTPPRVHRERPGGDPVRPPRWPSSAPQHSETKHSYAALLAEPGLARAILEKSGVDPPCLAQKGWETFISSVVSPAWVRR